MALRGKKPEAIQKRLKLLLYGGAGAGKTTAAIQFPVPYLIDTERGAENDEYVKALDRQAGAYLFTNDFDELVKEVKSLLTEKHDYRTLIIDPITTLHNDLIDKAAKKVGTDFGKHYGEANKQMRHLFNLLARLDMNVIVTAHSKTEYGEGLVKLGETFDGWKKLDYLFDLVLEVQKPKAKKGERTAVVRKTRIAGFPDGDAFPFSYAEIATRYGGDILERQAKSETLATPEQCKHLRRLCELLKVSADLTDKWLDKAQAETFEEMPGTAIQACIDHLEKQIKTTEAA